MMSQRIYTPDTCAAVQEIIAGAAADRRTLRIRGGDSKRLIRRCDPSTALLDMNSMTGITDYDPDELVMTVRAGTRLTEIEAALSERQQMLAFEPFDHAPLFGEPAGRATLGGIIAANVSGSRRLSAGAARDHMLGFTAVSGRGETFKGGGTVVKNVTGFDLPKLMAGSWGTLAVLTSITVRLLPQPRTEKTIVFGALSDDAANRLMTAAVSSPAAVSCAAHVATEAQTALRVEGFGPSVDVRCRHLIHALREFCAGEVLEAEASAAFWHRVRTVAPLPVAGYVLWRISVPPAHGWLVGSKLGATDARYLYDWGGALVWMALGEHARHLDEGKIQEIARELGGHAQLIRAAEAPPADCEREAGAAREADSARELGASREAGPAREAGSAKGASSAMRAVSAKGAVSAMRAVSARHGASLQASALAQLRLRVKAAYDPVGVLNPGVDLAHES
jgi:glycolate oxidase FAD binding subunit